MADAWNGLQLFDVTIPESPTHAGYFRTGIWAESTVADGEYVYVTDSLNGIWILRNTLTVPNQLIDFAAARSGRSIELFWRTHGTTEDHTFNIWRLVQGNEPILVAD